MPEKQAETEAVTDAPVNETGGGDEAKASRRKGEKQRRTHGERAAANLRSAKRSQREVTEPDDKARFLMAEAEVLALLELADAFRGSTNSEP
jgi:hypothetical protein